MSRWQISWAIAAVPVVGALIGALWRTVYSGGPTALRQGKRRSAYKSDARAITALVLGVLTAYYAAYVVISMLSGRITQGEALVHLAWWTLVPPSWFLFEWFVWFDNHDDPTAVALMRAGQDLASKFWASVLALMISLKIVEAVGQHLWKP